MDSVGAAVSANSALLVIGGVLFGLQTVLGLVARCEMRCTGLHRLMVCRELQIALTGLVLLAVQTSGVFTKAETVYGTVAVSLIARICNSARFFSSLVDRVYLMFLQGLMTKDEIRGEPPSFHYYLLGLAAIAGVFPQHIVTFATLIACLGNPAATLVGRVVPSPKLFFERTLIDGVVCFVVSALVVFACVSLSDLICPEPVSIFNLVTIPRPLVPLVMPSALAGYSGVVAALGNVLALVDVDIRMSLPVLSAVLLLPCVAVLKPCHSEEFSLYDGEDFQGEL